MAGFESINWLSTADECKSCHYGFNLDSTTKKCVEDTTKCIKRDASGKCILCQFHSGNGYGLNKVSNTCIENTNNNQFC
jgi:hypothetical protein